MTAQTEHSTEEPTYPRTEQRADRQTDLRAERQAERRTDRAPGERHIEVSLDKRDVRCTARLLFERAPLTCAAVWDALPLGSPVYHAKYARNEIYALFPAFAAQEPPLENPTVTPIPGDLCYFTFTDTELGTKSYGYDTEQRGTVVDLALFYERNNLLLNGDVGWVPGIVWGQVVDGLDRMAEACQDLWRSGAVGETLSFRRV